MLAISLGFANRIVAQTVSTGAVTASRSTLQGAVLPDVIVCLSKEGGGVVRSATSDEAEGLFPLRRPAHTKYAHERAAFEPLTLLAITRPR